MLLDIILKKLGSVYTFSFYYKILYLLVKLPSNEDSDSLTLILYSIFINVDGVLYLGFSSINEFLTLIDNDGSLFYLFW